MANLLTNTTFSSTYKDDFADSDHYHRILFKAGRALQARELTQMQTIQQKEMERFASNIFNEGGVVRSGNITLNTRLDYIKLKSISNNDLVDEIVGETFYVQGNTDIKVKILEYKSAENGDPPTLYVRYVNALGGTGTTPIKVPNNAELRSNEVSQQLQVAASDATGLGTKISVASGDYFVQGHFVFVKEQTIFVNKYSSTPTSEIGFQLIEDVVSVDDFEALYDNQGAQPNLASPGADRYRIRLTLIKKDDLPAGKNFVYLCNVVDGRVTDVSTPAQAYNVINDIMAQRTKEESGDYIVKPFIAEFSELNDSNLEINVSDGVAYVDGYRLQVPSKKITLPKAQDTTGNIAQNIVASYGNYVVGSSDDNKGQPNIHEFQEVNLRSATGHGGSTIGTARVRAIEENGDGNYRYYLFDIQMNSDQVFASVRSFGTSTSDYTNVVLESGDAILKSTGNNSLLFDLPNSNPSSTGVSVSGLTVQRRYKFTTDGSGDKQLLATDGDTVGSTYSHGAGTFTNSGDWIVSKEDSAVDTGATFSNLGSTVDISGLDASTTYELTAYVAVDTPTASTKQLNQNVEQTKSWPTDAESDGNGVQYIDLKKADIYRVTAIKVEDSDGADLSTNFTVDNGQRDNFYANGRIVANGGASIPTGNIFIKFDHFAINTKNDFFSVNSYDQVVDYEDIPNFTKANGEVVNLRNVLDFRSYPESDGTYDITNGIHGIPQNTDVITSTVNYYVPRKDRLVATVENGRDGRIGKGDIKLVSGVSSLNPQFPDIPTGSIPLYDISLNPYTLNESDLTSAFYENRRYTMKDISRLEKRLDDLTELTTLSLLEVNTNLIQVFDSSGNPRTKSGFLADAFTNYAFSAANSTQYKATVDTLENVLRPQVYANNIRLLFDSDTSVAADTVRKGDFALLDIDSNPSYLYQNVATGIDNINPFQVITQTGHITISPETDAWVETIYAPNRIVDGGTQVNNTNTSRAVNDINTFRSSWFGERVGDQVRVVTGSRVLRELIGERVLDISIIPFMRSIKVSFRAEGLRPNTRFFPLFDGVNISDYAREEAFQRFSGTTQDIGNLYTNRTSHPDGSTDLISDDNGSISGSFIIPSNSTLKFRTGTKLFKLLDISTDVEASSTSIARKAFSSQGAIETRQRSIRSTRILDTSWIIQRDDGENRDPLAQTFRVDQFENPNGIFVTKVDAFFKTKSTTNVPVALELRTVENGVPTSQAIPGAVKFLLPADVVTPDGEGLDEDVLDDVRQCPTTFEFDEPVFLNSGQEYAIVLLAESTEYNVYTAETYQFLLGSTEARVARQPTLGSMFISQNGSTWTPDQTKDLMFNIKRAQFASSGSVTLENASTPSTILGNNPFQTDSGSTTVICFEEGHGLSKGDKILIEGLDSVTTYAGILGSSLNGTRTVINVDHTGFTFAADSNATSSIRTGGNDITVSQNMIYNEFFPTVTTLIPENVSVSAKIKTVGSSSGTGVLSYANRRNLGPALSLAGTFETIALNEMNVTDEPKAILSDSNETFHLNANEKSFVMQLDLTTSDNKVSPVVDLQRANVTTFENLIDKPDASATDGFNVPLSFVAETHPISGSAAASHVTSIVSLDEPSVGIKIIVSANRPTDADFEVYYKTGTTDDNFDEISWVEIAKEFTNPADNDGTTFRDYEYLVGGQGGDLSAFSKFQIKIVMVTKNSSAIPTFRDLRAIALVI